MRLEHVLGDAILVIAEGTASLEEEHSAGVRQRLLKRGPQTSISITWELLKMPILRAQPRSTKSETVGGGPSNLCSNQPSRDF